VRDYLVERGVEPTRIRLVALGERRPVAPNALAGGADYPEGRAKNRRVGVEVRLPAGDADRNCAGEDADASSV
jgi:OOP family OmpA-OmpF porin